MDFLWNIVFNTWRVILKMELLLVVFITNVHININVNVDINVHIIINVFPKSFKQLSLLIEELGTWASKTFLNLTINWLFSK